MFQSLRVNQPFYILYKEVPPRVEVGAVTSVSQPVYKFPSAQPFGSPQEQVVDVYVNVNGSQRQFQQLPANKETADFGVNNCFVSASRDAMNAEVVNLKNAAETRINNIGEEHQKVEGYNAILQQINPEYAEKQRQEAEICNLKQQVAQMATSNANLEKMLGQVLAKLEGDPKQQKTK